MKIISLENMIEHVISDDTYIIRIKDMRWYGKKESTKIKNPEEYRLIIKKYKFDDIECFSSQRTWRDCGKNSYSFNRKIAEQIIMDFNEDYSINMDIIVHCLKGISRSPAIGMALNDIFDLGDDQKELKKRFPRYNKLVYRMMKEAADEIL